MTSATEARELLRQGRLPEAERAFERVLETSPNDVEALNVVALGALRQGNPRRAIGLLEHAVRVSPAHGPTRHALARAHEATGNLRAAIDSYASAVRAMPELQGARLQLAMCLERQGEHDRAVLQFVRALTDAQAQGKWLNAATTPAALRPLVEHAVRSVRAERHAAFERLLEPHRQRYGRSMLGRVERCIRIHMLEDQPDFPDPRQRPTFLFFPGLPASPYLDRSLFPWMAALETETSSIRAELEQLLPSSAGRERVFTTDELEQVNLRGLDVAPSWNGYYFYRHGERREENCASCPQTARALNALPLSFVPKHGPEVLYSVFTPGTHLLPHRGVTNTRLVGHLPLIVPPDCALNVGGEIHEWQEGRAVVFDDTYEHEAWNRSQRTRVVMIFDIWNPYLTEAERVVISDLVVAIGEFRECMEAA